MISSFAAMSLYNLKARCAAEQDYLDRWYAEHGIEAASALASSILCGCSAVGPGRG